MAASNLISRFGFNYFGNHCESSHRLELKDGKHFVSHRTVINHSNALLGMALIGDLCEKSLVKYDFILKYNHKKFDIAFHQLNF